MPHGYTPFQAYAYRESGDVSECAINFCYELNNVVTNVDEDLTQHKIFQSSWDRACREMHLSSVSSETSTRWKQFLLHCYAQPHRRYHTTEHLSECLQWLALMRPQLPLEDAGVIEMALWFHDAVYDLRAKDNELQSALLARDALTDLGANPNQVQQVERLILATRHQFQVLQTDEQWVVDIDLSILGASPDRFDRYESQIRQEYAHVPTWLFRWARRKFCVAF